MKEALMLALMGSVSPIGMMGASRRIDEDGGYHSPQICFVTTPATVWGTQMTSLQNNSGGGSQVLPHGGLVGGKECCFVESLVLSAQVSGTVIAVARLPIGAVFKGIQVTTDTSLGSTTIKFGNAGSGNSAIYGAAATLTATDTPTVFTKTGVHGVEIASGVDNGGAPSGSYEDIIMTLGAATAPGSGNMRIITQYVMP